jgi:hypothetical protein
VILHPQRKETSTLPKIIIECDGDISQNDIDKILEQAAKKQVSCKYGTRNAVLAKVKSGAARSEHDAEKQVAAETGEKLATVHKRNQRAKKKEIGTKNQDVPTHGGARPGAGRKPAQGPTKRGQKAAPKGKRRNSEVKRADERLASTDTCLCRDLALEHIGRIRLDEDAIEPLMDIANTCLELADKIKPSEPPWTFVKGWTRAESKWWTFGFPHLVREMKLRKLSRENGKISDNEVFMDMSRESGIPSVLLKRWVEQELEFRRQSRDHETQWKKEKKKTWEGPR